MKYAQQNLDELNELFAKYLPRLIILAEARIQPKHKRRFDGCDIADTVLGTVVRRIDAGIFEFEDEAELWRLLVTIAIRKISNKIRGLNTEKGNQNKEVAYDEGFHSVLSREPTADAATSFVELLERLNERLDETAKAVLSDRMNGMEYSEIAAKLDVTERTVGRKIRMIKDNLNELMQLDQSI